MNFGIKRKEYKENALTTIKRRQFLYLTSGGVKLKALAGNMKSTCQLKHAFLRKLSISTFKQFRLGVS